MNKSIEQLRIEMEKAKDAYQHHLDNKPPRQTCSAMICYHGVASRLKRAMEEAMTAYQQSLDELKREDT